MQMKKACDKHRNQRVLWDPVQRAEGFAFSNPERDHFLAIAVSDTTGWEELIMADGASAKSDIAALRRLTAIISERNPDVLEGHNIFGFDLPFMATRAERLGIRLLWGRDGTDLYRRLNYFGAPVMRKAPIAGRHVDVQVWGIRGRHVVDTMILAMQYDVAERQLTTYGLKAVASALGVQEKDRVILEGADIQRAYHEDPEKFATYARQDVRETRAISGILSQSAFIQTQMFPMNYQDVILAGPATKVNALLLREYLRADAPIPTPPNPRRYRGALCELHQKGVIEDVWHCDVQSLYPSVMLLFNCLPKADSLGVLRAALSDLRDYRLQVKRIAEITEDRQRRTTSTRCRARSRF